MFKNTLTINLVIYHFSFKSKEFDLYSSSNDFNKCLITQESNILTGFLCIEQLSVITFEHTLTLASESCLKLPWPWLLLNRDRELDLLLIMNTLLISLIFCNMFNSPWPWFVTSLGRTLTLTFDISFELALTLTSVDIFASFETLDLSN